MSKPKLKIKKDSLDLLVEVVSVIFLALMFIWPFVHFQELPQFIPKHYSPSGLPDAFGKKHEIWILPAIGLVLFVVLTVLNRYPHLFNYPTEITQNNAKRQYKIATKLLRSIKLVICASFFYIGYATVQTALHRQSGLGAFFMPVFLGAIAITIGVYMYMALKKKRQTDMFSY